MPAHITSNGTEELKIDGFRALAHIHDGEGELNLAKGMTRPRGPWRSRDDAVMHYTAVGSKQFVARGTLVSTQVSLNVTGLIDENLFNFWRTNCSSSGIKPDLLNSDRTPPGP
jgi:hypothetical protein